MNPKLTLALIEMARASNSYPMAWLSFHLERFMREYWEQTDITWELTEQERATVEGWMKVWMDWRNA